MITFYLLWTILYSYGPVEPDIFEGFAVPVPYGLYFGFFFVPSFSYWLLDPPGLILSNDLSFGAGVLSVLGTPPCGFGVPIGFLSGISIFGNGLSDVVVWDRLFV